MFLSIQEAKKDLGFDDARSVYRWLRYNGICPLSDPGSNKHYVIKEEFEIARFREAIKYIVAKYGNENVPEIFNSIMKFSAEYKTVIDNAKKKYPYHTKGYMPKGELEKNYLTDLLNGL